jgi:hypothetical protein
MPAKLGIEQMRLIVVIAVGCAAGNLVGRSLFLTTPTWLAVLIGSATAVVVGLGLAGVMSLFLKR